MLCRGFVQRDREKAIYAEPPSDDCNCFCLKKTKPLGHPLGHRGVSARDRHSYNLAVEQLQPTGRRLLGDVLALSLSGPLLQA